MLSMPILMSNSPGPLPWETTKQQTTREKHADCDDVQLRVFSDSGGAAEMESL